MQQKLIFAIGILLIIIGSSIIYQRHREPIEVPPETVDDSIPSGLEDGESVEGEEGLESGETVVKEEPGEPEEGQKETPPAQGASSFKSKAYQQIESKRAQTSTTREQTQGAPSKVKKELTQLLKEAKGLQKKDPVRANETFQKAAEMAKDNPDALAELAEAFLAAHKLDEARDYVLQCLAIAPDHERCTRILGDILYKSGNLEEYFNYLQDCLAQNPRSRHCLVGLVRYYFGKKNFPKAYEIIKKIQSYYPNAKETFEVLGDYHYKIGELDTALNNYRIACRMKSDYSCRQVGALRISD